MNEANPHSDFPGLEKSKNRSMWLPGILKWCLDFFWYIVIAVSGICVLFFLIAGIVTELRFTFPFHAPVKITLDSVDSLSFNFSASTDSLSITNLMEDAAQLNMGNSNDGHDVYDYFRFKAFALKGDLLFTVPMRTLWPFLLAGLFTPLAVALVIAWQLRQILKSVCLSRPFEQANIRRVKIIGWLVLIIDPLDSLIAYLSATSLLPRVVDTGLKMTNAFSFEYQSVLIGILILTLVHIFEAGARMQSEQELTI